MLNQSKHACMHRCMLSAKKEICMVSMVKQRQGDASWMQQSGNAAGGVRVCGTRTVCWHTHSVLGHAGRVHRLRLSTYGLHDCC